MYIDRNVRSNILGQGSSLKQLELAFHVLAFGSAPILTSIF